MLTRIALVIACLCPAALVDAQRAEPAPLLVDAAWLSAHLDDPHLVVFHVDNEEEYKAGHIPGARFIDLDDISAAGPLMLELPAPDDLQARLQRWGVSDDSRIVVYYGRSGRVQSATRMLLTLDHAGLGAHASLLNGGLSAWVDSSRSVTTVVPTITPGVLRPLSTKAVTVDADYVKHIAAKPAHVLVDARASDFYDGTKASFDGHGHIPGAINIPFTELLDAHRMVDTGRLEQVFAKAGVKPGDTVVAYCHLGQQATAIIFAARVLGHPALLYDGSIQDWATNTRGPLVK